MTVRRKLDVRSSLGRATDAVSRPAHGMDQWGRKALVHLAAQPADQGFDDVGARIEMQVPDLFEQHRAGDHLTRIAHQIFQQAILARLQLDRLITPPYCTCQQVELEIMDAKLLLGYSAV